MKIYWKTERRKVKDLKEFEGNPRMATEKDIEDLDQSLKRFDVAEPLVINTDGEVIGGNFRLSRIKEMGLEEVDVRVPDRILTRKEAEELNLRLNKNIARWDNDLLANFSEDLLKDIGWESEELDKIFQLDAGEDDFDADEEYGKIKKPKTKTGDIFKLGEHCLMCGDSTKKEDVERLMEGEKADMVFTDPPYGVKYEGGGKKWEMIKGDDLSGAKMVEFAERFSEHIKNILKSGGTFYICSGYNSYPIFVYAILKNGMNVSTTITWVKHRATFHMNTEYQKQQEIIIKGKNQSKKGQPIIYGWNNGAHYFEGIPGESDVWEIKRRTIGYVHPTQKPLELVGRAIRNSSKRGEIILDLFGGSGSTLISAEKEKRKANLMELDPKYCDVIIKRFEAFTGKKAVLVEKEHSQRAPDGQGGV